MNLKKLLDRVTAGFIRTRTKVNEESRDVAVADVALMLAALDGTVLPEELAAYRWIAGRCRRLSDNEQRQHLDAAVRKAGHLLLMAQIDAYTQDELLTAFSAAVNEVLPTGLTNFPRTDIRRAFILWTAAALADGEISEIEKLAITHLLNQPPASEILEVGFLETAERLLRAVPDPTRHDAAESALDELVVFRKS